MTPGVSTSVDFEPGDTPAPEHNVRPLVDTALLPDWRGAGKVVHSAHRLYEHLISLWAPGVIEAAHDLGVFAELSKGARTSDQLAEACDANQRAMRVLMDGLFAYDIVDRIPSATGPSVYRMSDEMSECLLPGGLFSLVGKIEYDRQLAWHSWRNLADAVRTDNRDASGDLQLNQISEHNFESLVRGINFWAPPIVEALCAGFETLAWPTDRPASVLDIGCGTGLYSQLLLEQFPKWRATGLEAPHIAPIAEAQAARIGVADRFGVQVRDFWTESWGSDHDLLIFVNIFHLQTPESAMELLHKSQQALGENGLICIADHMVTDEQDAKPVQDRFAMLFAASMLATGGGDAFLLDEYDTWLAAAGLRRVAVLDTPMHRILLAGHA
ncbi:class I SAM-dependent methyltransferase [Streptomyces sp. NPDC005925]|uniref:class I SAM-dependent methyltransferase n=1 Tax=Streptomyces sp. NPDC005925 TaxID=3157172 RepID=UPI0033D6BC6F